MNAEFNQLVERFNEVAPKMDSLNRHVHELVLSEQYLVGKSRKIQRAIKSVLGQIDGKMIDKAVLGKLSYKLPKVLLQGTWSEADKVIATKITAGIILQYLIDSEYIKTHTELNVMHVDGKKVFRRERFIMLDNDIDPKELLRGLHERGGVVMSKGPKVKVGGKPLKHTAEQKQLLSRMAEWRFRLSDVATKELLLKFYSLGDGYQSTLAGKSMEDPIMMKKRYNNYADTIMGLQGKTFHFSVWLDARTRLYYDMTLEGLSPQGKLFETLLIDIVEPYMINEDGYKELVHIMMVTLRGRMTMDEALKQFEADTVGILDTIYDIDLMSATSKDEMGEWLLLKKLTKAYVAYKQGKPCYYIFGKDLTNSGLGVAGCAFKSEKMMLAANYGGVADVKDSHAEYARSFGLTRSEIKSLHTGLLHGSTFKAMAEDLVAKIKKDKFEWYTDKYGIDGAEDKFMEDYSYIDAQFIKNNSIEAYGVEVLNIDTIATWGGSVINNRNTSLMWNTLDGWKAQSTAYMERVPVTLYVVSTTTQSGYAKWNITCDLPIVISRKGELVYGKEDGAIVKKRGLYANITHATDAFILRGVIKYALANNYPSLYKHDDYMLPLNAFKGVREVVKERMLSVYKVNTYARALKQIKENHSQYIEVPSLLEGDGTETMIRQSEHFLMP
jgi:hypothetical protein